MVTDTTRLTAGFRKMGKRRNPLPHLRRAFERALGRGDEATAAVLLDVRLRLMREAGGES